MKKFNELREELSESILLGKSVQMGERRGRIIKVVSVGGTSRYDAIYQVKFQDGTKIEMHDTQIRPFLIEEHGAGEEATDELDDKYREDTPGEEVEEARKDVFCIVDKKGKVVAANLTKQNSHKEISRHRDATIVLDPDAKVGDTLKYFAKESVEQLDETSAKEIESKGDKLFSDKYRRSFWYYKGYTWMIDFRGAHKLWPGTAPIEESAPTNSVGGGMSPHFGGEGGVQGTDPLLGKKKKKRKKFAGAEVFELSGEEYHKCMHGRKKYERWNRRLNMENIDNQDIRSYAHKNPGKPIVVMDKTTGMMSYFYHGDKK